MSSDGVVLRYARILLAILAPGALASGMAQAQGAAAGTPLAIENVTVIDVLAADPAAARRPGMTVTVRDGRIEGVQPSPSAKVPEGATRIDGTGRFLMPALWDMHVHMMGPPESQKSIHLAFVANGVVNVRDLGTNLSREDLVQWRDRIGKGEAIGARILASPLRITYGFIEYDAAQGHPKFFYPRTAEDGRKLLRRAREFGADFIKPYDTLPRAAYFALMEEAKKTGMPVGGHVPESVTAIEAAEAGQRSIEHAITIPYNCAPAGEPYRRTQEEVSLGRHPRTMSKDPKFLREVHAGFDPEECKRILARLAKTGVYYVPTHMTRKVEAFAPFVEQREHPNLKYIHPLGVDYWVNDMKRYAEASVSDREAYMDFFLLGLEVTRLAHEAGVKILVGTDANDSYVFPGFSLHEEMYHLVSAGLPPLAVLRGATILPAEYFNLQDERGSISPGKTADLLLLKADPLVDIRNTRAIETLVYGGRTFTRAALDDLLLEAERTSNEARRARQVSNR